jgi:large subunit ribosomal protein L10e
MRLSYGRPIGTAAQVKPGQSIILVKVASDKKAVAKEALRRASAKIPTTSHVIYNQ